MVVGQDGLVANAAKYVNGLPILAINPDISRNKGILLPFTPGNFESGLLNAIEMKAYFRKVTMAEANMNDGQKLPAFNDFFIGPSSHITARYRITHGDRSENQSSSGIIVSTGAGSTGWLSSLLNMANGIGTLFSRNAENVQMSMMWEDNDLVFIVREPFLSKYSGISLTAGRISQERKLKVESLMPSNGLIFSDGIEADYLTFNSGSVVEIGIAGQKAMIIQNVSKH